MDKRLKRKLDTKKDQVIKGYRNGMSLEDLAKLYKVAPNTIRNLLAFYAVPIRKQGRNIKYDNKQTSQPNTV